MSIYVKFNLKKQMEISLITSTKLVDHSDSAVSDEL